MANAIYPKYKQSIISGGSNVDMSAGTVKVAMVDTGTYTYSSSDQYYSSVSSAVVGTPAALSSKTFTNGTFDAADVTFTAVSGSSVEALVIYVDSGSSATSPLVAYIDTNASGLPLTPNGGNVTLTWNASGIFTL